MVSNHQNECSACHIGVIMSLFDTQNEVPVGKYPASWKLISRTVKEEAEWRCERCQHVHGPAAGYTLTVHHLIPEKFLSERWNLASLCQRCHLRMHGRRIDLYQTFMFNIIPPSEWFIPHLTGFLNWYERKKQNDTNHS